MDRGSSEGELTLREAGPIDDGRIVTLYREMAAAHGDEMTEAETADKLRRMRRVPHRITLLCRDGETVGYAFWLDLGDHVFIRSFAIAEGERSAGLGRLFFERLVAEVFPDLGQIRLQAKGEGAKRFWTAVGFQSSAEAMRIELPETP
ncbi:MAG: GNAT family N-acetyltransferase [Pseudomonadota bacterium]